MNDYATYISCSFRRIGTEDDIVFHERVRVELGVRPIVLPLYIECYFGWFIDETLSSLLAWYRLFHPLFLHSPYQTYRERHSRSPAAFIPAVQPSLHSPLFSSPPLPLSLTLYRHSEWQALVTSPRLEPADCTFRRSAGFKKWEEEEKSEKKRNESERTDGNDKFAKGKRRKAVWSINDPFILFVLQILPCRWAFVCWSRKDCLWWVNFSSKYFDIHMYKGRASGKWANPISG